MKNNRIIISTLTLTGKDIKDAKVKFTKGLNFVTGPSNTGKTFILNCIDYMFGAKDFGMDIPELAPYDTIHMELIDSLNVRYYISRDLKGGRFILKCEGEEQKELAPKHSNKDCNNLSNYLLNKIGLANKNVVKNKDGETRSLSYRDIVHLTIVPEDKMIQKESPIFELGVTFKTVEISIFNLLLSGGKNDVIANDKEKKSSSEANNIIQEVYKNEILLREQKLKDLNVSNNLEQIELQIDEINSILLQINHRINEMGASLNLIELDRKHHWEELKKNESKKEVLLGLLERFELLQRQYTSDLGRLEAIRESWSALSKINEKKCPICGALPEYHDASYNDCYVSEKSIMEACSKEIKNITILGQDLKNTVTIMNQEVTSLSDAEHELKQLLELKNGELKNILNPKMNGLLDEYRKRQRERDALIIAKELINQIEKFQEQFRLLGNSGKIAAQPDSFEIQNLWTLNSTFCENVENILKAWEFPNNGTVEFDKESYDLIIGEKKRSSHGKGVRALTHAAFTLGLLDYCNTSMLPHPGIVILDSPLIVYKQPDREETNFSKAVKECFLIDIANRFRDSQVIVLENENIDKDFENDISINVVRFTGNSQGRFGFL